MASKKIVDRFNKELIRLFDTRVHGLRAMVQPRKGAAPKMTKSKILRSIERLQGHAKDALIRSKPVKSIVAKYDYKKQWHAKRGKGFGRTEKKRNFMAWYDKHIGAENCVYAFWNGKGRCLYVGRTLNGKGRPVSHFEKHWFGKATRIDIYAFDRKRGVPRFECLLTHLHEPTYSKIKPARKKYYSRCPICDGQRRINTEIKSLFRLK